MSVRTIAFGRTFAAARGGVLTRRSRNSFRSSSCVADSADTAVVADGRGGDPDVDEPRNEELLAAGSDTAVVDDGRSIDSDIDEQADEERFDRTDCTSDSL